MNGMNRRFDVWLLWVACAGLLLSGLSCRTVAQEQGGQQEEQAPSDEARGAGSAGGESTARDEGTGEQAGGPSDEGEDLVAGKYRVLSTQRGEASWYSVKTNGGTTTASGEKLRDGALTAAHRKLRFGTRVRVTNQRNGRSVIVRITDRGPFIKGRVIDVSLAAARKLNFVQRGVAPVKLEVLKKAVD